MNMPSIDLSQMLAPQSPFKGGAFKGATGGEGFLAAFNQVAAGSAGLAAGENVLGALLKKLDLNQPGLEKALLQWLQQGAGQEQLEALLFEDGKIDLEEMLSLLQESGLVRVELPPPEPPKTQPEPRAQVASAPVASPALAEAVEGGKVGEIAGEKSAQPQTASIPQAGAKAAPEILAFHQEGTRPQAVALAAGGVAEKSTDEVLAEAAVVSAKASSPARSANSLEARFAELLGAQPRQEPLRAGDAPRPQAAVAQVSVAPEALAASGSSQQTGDQTDLGAFLNHKPVVAAPVAAVPEQGAVFTLDGARPVQVAAAPAIPTPPPGSFHTPAGHLVSDNQLLNQVVDNLQLRSSGERSQMTLRLHPEDLGELRLEVVMEKGALKAHFHAQTAQVQDALERHLPRLREALESQGFKLDDVDVSVDSQQQHKGREWFGEHQRRNLAWGTGVAAKATAGDFVPEAVVAAKAAAASTGGINLRI